MLINSFLYSIFKGIVFYYTEKLYDWLHYIETYIFADWQFLNFLLVLLSLDGILEIYIAYKNKVFNFKSIGLLFQKALIYTCFLVLVHILSHFTVEGEKNSFFGWFNGFAYLAIIVRESIYILENMTTIRPGLIPGWIIKKLKQYDKEGFLQPVNQNDGIDVGKKTRL